MVSQASSTVLGFVDSGPVVGKNIMLTDHEAEADRKHRVQGPDTTFKGTPPTSFLQVVPCPPKFPPSPKIAPATSDLVFNT